MKEVKLQIKNKLGIHARPAMLFAQTANQFESDVYVTKDDLEVNGKSVLGLMMLVAPQGSEITIRCEGPDEEEAIKALTKIVEEGFGEE
ncbi:MAG: HPr family phosphocarrier protein [candidate division WOR-3 bacterium]